MRKLTKKQYWVGGFFSVVLAAALIRLAIALTAFAPADQPTGYIAQNEVSNFNLTSGNETMFRTEYDKEFYAGNLYAYRIDGSGNFTPAAELWSGGAAVHIDAQDPATERFIGTMMDSGGGLGTGVAFTHAALSATQKGYMGANAADQRDVIDFLRGDRSVEIQNNPDLGAHNVAFRQRGSALGDIVHSRPYYVADATNPTIFVGANDGMLHAIDADPNTGGAERWAYVPSMLLSKMKALSVHPYVRDYYVDGQINVATILSGSKRILVGGLGAGGKGLYALNITGTAGLTADSNATAGGKVLWEITPTTVNYAAPTTANAYVNLGYTYGTPTLVKVAGVDAVIIGNGYNNGHTGYGGDYGSWLYVINANTGQLIKKFSAGTGTALSPNGLMTPTAIDANNDGSADYVYAGDLNGTMWKFDLANATDTAGAALHVTSPAQPITATPAVSAHPNGGFMVNFATGAMFSPADTTDSSVHYVYGIWDGAPVTNTNIVTQTLTARVFADTTRVRNVTTNAMNWAIGNDKGWKVALPAGEKVVGEGSYVANKRYYFTSHNPTVGTLVSGTSTTVYGDNWLTELDYLSGGNLNQPFLDLSGDLLLNDSDRILYIGTDRYVATDVYTIYDAAPPVGKAVGDVIAPALVGQPVALGRVGRPIPHSAGIPVAKFLNIGVTSQPILVQLVTLNDTLFNQSPDVKFPVIAELTLGGRGVAGGHFDYDIYYNGPASTTGGTKATATITVGTAGQDGGRPATLGVISLNGVTVFPALTITDLADGTAATTNAIAITGKVTGGFTATRSGNVITITAPDVGTFYNDKTFTIAAGTSQAGADATPATSKIVISAPTTTNKSRINDVTFGGTSILTTKPLVFAENQTVSQIASALSDKLSPPSGYTKTITTTNVANDTITITKDIPVGAEMPIVVTSTAAAAVAGSTGTSPTGTFRITKADTDRKLKKITCRGPATDIQIMSPADAKSNAGTAADRVKAVAALVSTRGAGGYSLSCTNASPSTCTITGPIGLDGCSPVRVEHESNLGINDDNTNTNVDFNLSGGSAAVTEVVAADKQPTTVSSVAGTAGTGWTDFKPALTAVAFSGGVDGDTTVTAGAACIGKACASKDHVHEYDDKYDRTGVNFLDGSAGVHDLTKAMGVSSTAQFKVLVQNQYLSPAVQLHIGNPSYVFNVDAGYIAAKTYTTSTTLSLASLPTYKLSTIGSLAVNMPADAFAVKDWWAGYQPKGSSATYPADKRVGLHPTQTGCVKTGAGANDGNMFQPVDPPASVTATGNGTLGYNADTTPTTATGVRHNGAFTLQVISASTLDSEIEMSIPGKPEYGWRLKSAAYHSRLLAEWTLFWHHDNKLCYGAAGWTKLPLRDMRPCGPTNIGVPSETPNTGDTQVCVAAVEPNLGTDPKIDNFSVGCSTSFTKTGNVEVRTSSCTDGKAQIITKTRNDDGSVTIRIQYTPPTGGPTVEDPAPASDTTITIAADGGQTTSGGDERGLQPRTGRISWRELIRP